MKVFTHDPAERAKSRKWLTILWTLAGFIYLLAALLDKNKTDRNFHIATAIIYFAISLLGIFLIRRNSKKKD
jgi:membrane-bound metal-dependent hydrolase YbcI (DUF457 family)